MPFDSGIKNVSKKVKVVFKKMASLHSLPTHSLQGFGDLALGHKMLHIVYTPTAIMDKSRLNHAINIVTCWTRAARPS